MLRTSLPAVFDGPCGVGELILDGLGGIEVPVAGVYAVAV